MPNKAVHIIFSVVIYKSINSKLGLKRKNQYRSITMPHRTTQKCSGVPSSSTAITALCDALLYHSAHAHRKSRVRSNNAPTRKVYVTLVCLQESCCAVTCCGTAVKSPSLICSHSLIIHVYLMFLYTEYSVEYSITKIFNCYSPIVNTT